MTSSKRDTIKNRKNSKSQSKSRTTLKGVQSVEGKPKTKDQVTRTKGRVVKSPASQERYEVGIDQQKKMLQQISPIHKNRQSIYIGQDEEEGEQRVAV